MLSINVLFLCIMVLQLSICGGHGVLKSGKFFKELLGEVHLSLKMYVFLSVRLNHLTASCVASFDRPFRTLALGFLG